MGNVRCGKDGMLPSVNEDVPSRRARPSHPGDQEAHGPFPRPPIPVGFHVLGFSRDISHPGRCSVGAGTPGRPLWGRDSRAAVPPPGALRAARSSCSRRLAPQSWALTGRRRNPTGTGPWGSSSQPVRAALPWLIRPVLSATRWDHGTGEGLGVICNNQEKEENAEVRSCRHFHFANHDCHACLRRLPACHACLLVLYACREPPQSEGTVRG